MLLWTWAVTSFILPLLSLYTCSAQVKQTLKPIFTHKPFLVIWNAPTQDCKPRYKIDVNLKVFDAEASPIEGFVKQKLTLFYKDRLGLYPFYNENNVSMNGGLPQNSSLSEHINKLQDDVEKYTPPKSEDGLAVIDWEEWRPLWIRNWEAKDIYRTKSISLVSLKHPDWSSEKVKQEALFEFETAAKEFMARTLRRAKFQRPNQLWGYYLFPDCYNHDYKKNWENYTGRCPDVEVSRNDQLIWLWQNSTAVYPSIYLDKQLKSSENGRKFVHYRVKEAMRVSNLHHESFSLPVFVYTRLTYQSSWETLSEVGNQK
ncbi:hyaluronidase-2-like [Protopterus annectens]|uniref:hyaluronidase-2-like n=1 Tax=Protopterus annectens TaxID=7888 RepID=UPI001CFB110A|nr:hyaluronidase-2-like [Protopterus annectens]XP_043933506.1 hyaluronidase-2-like [Protopterus annectens]